jgi:hypothetical protein
VAETLHFQGSRRQVSPESMLDTPGVYTRVCERFRARDQVPVVEERKAGFAVRDPVVAEQRDGGVVKVCSNSRHE